MTQISGEEHRLQIDVVEFKSLLGLYYADIAQLVEFLPSKQIVEGSSPFVRSRENACSEVHLVQT